MKEIDKNSLIKVDHVGKSFEFGEAGVEVLKDVSFSIPKGSFTIIHGPSGSGKSTLLNTITGLEMPSTGQILYQNKDIYSLSPTELAHFRAKTMGIVYQQNYWVKSLTVLENVALPLYFLGYSAAKAEAEALESLKRVGMEQHAKKRPTVLSGGEQQRVSMARALISNPTYIVADEPTGNLDSKNGDAIMELLRYCNEKLGRTVILVTHNLEYLPMGTQILSVKDGVVTEVSNHGPKKHHDADSKGDAVYGKNIVEVIDKFRSIRLKILWRMALAGLKFKRLRSSLTILGVVIGIGSIFLLLSFGLGLQNLVKNEIVGAKSVKIIDVSSPNTEVLKLDNANLDRFQNIAHVTSFGKLNSSAGEIKFQNANSDAVIYGVDEDYIELSNLSIVAGKLLDPSDTKQLLISKSLLESLGYEDLAEAVGKEISLDLKLDEGTKAINEPFTVVGVMDIGRGPALYISGSVYQVAGADEYQQIKVVVEASEHVETVRKQIESFGFETTSPLDTLEQVNRFFKFFNVILVAFGSIGMVIAVLGMLNTLTISLLERTKEIGLMVALGGRRKDMKRLFIMESLLLSLIGGVVGIFGATILGLSIDAVFNQMASGRGVTNSFSLFSNPAWLSLVTVMFMAGVGYMVAYLPAKRASRINPIDALRHE